MEFVGFDFRDSDDLDPRADSDRWPTDRTDESAYSNLRAHAWERTDPHEPGAAARPNYDDVSAADLEATYRAKNGANEMNDNEAASQFFIREMRQRCIQHADLFWGAETPGDRLRRDRLGLEHDPLLDIRLR